ncbi:MAG: protein kinase [Blastocatellia bacterium]|nr:protein kinase [Blastocatellia bacterium]
MNPKNWKEIEEIFHTVTNLSPPERGKYLDRVCQKHPSLRTEIESLIANFENNKSFMEEPAFNKGLELISKETTDLVGKEVGSYRLLKLLGKGGMGEVYLSEDFRLNRKVALKFISNKFTNDSWAKRRLLKEAQAVAQLDHPNICTLYALQEEKEQSFMVMQYIEGETVASLIEKECLKIEKVYKIASEVASALAEAHFHGIIHRDIKPQNIMIAVSGQAKVLDFGLAKIETPIKEIDNTSDVGLIVGTVAYMSPEQLRAEKLDFRTDIFSFGIMLYEMVTAKNPFRKTSSAETISTILKDKVPTPTGLKSRLEFALIEIAQKCLEKNPKDRYQSFSELLLDLDDVEKKATSRLPRLKSFKYNLVIFFFALLFVAFAITLKIFPSLSTKSTNNISSSTIDLVASEPTLLILPPNESTKNNQLEYLYNGLFEDLIQKLSSSKKLEVKKPKVIPERKNSAEYFQKIGHDFKAQYILDWHLVNQSNYQLLQIKLIDTKEGLEKWQKDYILTKERIVKKQEEINNDITQVLEISLSDKEKELLVKITNPKAKDLYFKGRHFLENKNIQKAINTFQEAIELDPASSRAYVGFAMSLMESNSAAYGSVSTKETINKVKAALRRAKEIEEAKNTKTAETFACLGTIKMKYDWDWKGAEKDFLEAIKLDQNYTDTYYEYSNLLALMGRDQESIKYAEKAKELDPFSFKSHLNLGRSFYLAGDYKNAEKIYNYVRDNANREFIGQKRAFNSSLHLLSILYLVTDRTKEAIKLLEHLYFKEKITFAATMLIHAYVKAVRIRDARKLCSEIERMPIEKFPIQERAISYLALDKEKAAKLFDQACSEKIPLIPFIVVEPLFKDLRRSDHIFLQIAKSANLQQ